MKRDHRLTILSETKQVKGGWECGANVTKDLTSCTLNTRYEDLGEVSDILTLAHFPKTVVLLNYEI